MHAASYGLICLLSIGVAVYALVSYALFPLGASVHPDMRATFELHRIGIYSHVFAAAVALLLGPLQFSRRLRTAHPALHRVSGRIYLVAGVCVGGLAGLYMAMFAYGGIVSSIGFALLALAWLYTGARAYAAARARHGRAKPAGAPPAGVAKRHHRTLRDSRRLPGAPSAAPVRFSWPAAVAVRAPDRVHHAPVPSPPP